MKERWKERWRDIITVRITVKLVEAVNMEGIDAADRCTEQGKGHRGLKGKESKAEHQIEAVIIFK